MRALNNYSAQEQQGGLALSFEDARPQLLLPGVLVEKGFKLANCDSLWLTSNDCPYEETLFVSLVNSQGCIVDKLEIYKPYTPGILSEVVVVSGSRIQFKFWSEKRHQLLIDLLKFTLMLETLSNE
ncbi:hypothetical protein OAG1_33620 [Agarivorans sp. OAG1]|uniref:hypothetical protein n=1 Tax=Agarivorans sp. OAG1 TaxID=3082387 RepID=UPI002B2B0842|nr:hypothetical protein OAG1_33620 [Agarivorans sp. OAG1]